MGGVVLAAWPRDGRLIYTDGCVGVIILGSNLLISLSTDERRVLFARPANRLTEALSRKSTKELHVTNLRADEMSS